MKKRCKVLVQDGFKQLTLDQCFKKSRKPHRTFGIDCKIQLLKPFPVLMDSDGDNNNNTDDELDLDTPKTFTIEKSTLPIKFPSLPNSLEIPTMDEEEYFDASQSLEITFQIEDIALKFNENSPPKSQVNPNESANDSFEQKELNPIVATCMDKIINWIQSHPILITLLSEEEIGMLHQFLKLNRIHKLFCMKLFTRKDTWYNINKLVQLMKLNLEETEIEEMYNLLTQDKFLSTDFHIESNKALLNLLLTNDIKDLCKSFKIKLTNVRRDDMIDKLLRFSNLPALSFATSNPKDILRRRIELKLGKSIRMSENLRNLLNKVNLMYCFATEEFRAFSDLYLFMHQITTNVVFLPEYLIDTNTQLFADRQHFCDFLKALQLKRDLNMAIEKKDQDTILNLSRSCFTCLKDELQSIVKTERKHFLPGHKYASALTKSSEILTRLHFAEVFDWLQLLISQNQYQQRKRGFWYRQIVLIQYQYMKKHLDAANTLISALKDSNLSDIDKCELSKKGNLIKNAKKNKVDDPICEAIARGQSQSTFDFPTIVIDAIAMQGNTPGSKRKYREVTNGEQGYFVVEEIAINHYNRLGFTNVIHCEGRLFRTLFFLLFWDIIYDHSIPAVFINEIQTYPLDLYTSGFFDKREEAILNRIADIETNWTKSELKQFVCDMWMRHSNKQTCIGGVVDNHLDLYYILVCIGRLQTAKIMERFCKNFGLYSAGLPDLFMWDLDNKQCKFVEVKGEHDKLSTKQELWLLFLKNLGLKVEICHVHTVGSRGGAKHKHEKRLKVEN